MTQFKKQQNWFINNCDCLLIELYIIHGNGKHNNSCVVLECIKQLQSNVLHSANHIQFIDFIQMHFEQHSYFRNIFHCIKGIKHIVNLLTSCEIPKITSPLNSLRYHSTQILSFNGNHIVSILKVLSLLAEHHINKCIQLVLNVMSALLSLLKTNDCRNQIYIMSKMLHIEEYKSKLLHIEEDILSWVVMEL